MLSEQQFIHTDLRKDVEHRLEYFKSADFWGLAGPQTPKEGYLTLIFIQADWR